MRGGKREEREICGVRGREEEREEEREDRERVREGGGTAQRGGEKIGDRSEEEEMNTLLAHTR